MVPMETVDLILTLEAPTQGTLLFLGKETIFVASVESRTLGLQ